MQKSNKLLMLVLVVLIGVIPAYLYFTVFAPRRVVSDKVVLSGTYSFIDMAICGNETYLLAKNGEVCKPHNGWAITVSKVEDAELIVCHDEKLYVVCQKVILDLATKLPLKNDQLVAIMTSLVRRNQSMDELQAVFSGNELVLLHKGKTIYEKTYDNSICRVCRKNKSTFIILLDYIDVRDTETGSIVREIELSGN